MNSGNRVLMVVDMQKGFMSSKADESGVVPRVVDLVRWWDATGQDMVFTRFLNYPGSQFERLIHWSRFMPGEDEVEIIPELAEAAARSVAVVDKPGQYSPFTPEFTRLAHQRGWNELVIAGIATESCVAKSAMDAFELGYTPWVVTDASFSHAGQDKHDAGVLVIKRFIGRDQMIIVDQVFRARSQAA